METADTSTLVFFTGNDHLEYKAGHFLTIDPHQFEALERFTAFLEDLKGKREPPRAYSMCSAPHERYLAVTVKEEQHVSGATKLPAAAVAAAGQENGEGDAAHGHGLHWSAHAVTGHRLADRSHRAYLRRIWQRPELLDAEARAGVSPEAPAHLHLLEQDMARHHFP